jgi:hypothetical protein
MYSSDPARQCTSIVVCGCPILRVSTNRSQLSIDRLPRAVAPGALADIALLRREAATQSGERVLAEQLRMPGPQSRQRLDDDVGVAKFRQRPVDRTEPLAAPTESAAAVFIDELEDRTSFLHTPSRLVDRLVARRPHPSKCITSRRELFSRKPTEPMRYRFLGA